MTFADTDILSKFLPERDPVAWTTSAGFPVSLSPLGVFTQDAPNGLEVALVQSAKKPLAADLRTAWSKRKGNRASPVLLITVYPTGMGNQATLCGPVETPAVYPEVELHQAERLAETALNEPNRHQATRMLLAALPELGSDLPGFRNMGLLATQELKAGVRQRTDWNEAARSAKPLLPLRGRSLVERLGFEIQTLSTNTSILTIDGRRQALAVFCDDTELMDAPARRFDNLSPVSHALAIADNENVPWVVLTRASEIRLYSSEAGKGVGGKGRTETFVEINLSLIPERLAGYLMLLFSAQALAQGGSLDEILSDSSRYAADLAVRLRERVYRKTMPLLAKAVTERMESTSEEDLKDAYEQAITILFRLLFVAYAEDQDLLPYKTNGRYRDHSLTRSARRLAEDRKENQQRFDEHSTSLWDDVCTLWQAVDRGNVGFGVPEYNGGLFATDPEVSPTGATIHKLALSDDEFGPALDALLIDDGPEGVGPVDFRALSVREFGTIYEGLLESQLSLAEEDLALNRKGVYVPVDSAGKGAETAIPAGEVYLHGKSGARKETGSYFTKPFVVEHLLDKALTPALDTHIATLEKLRDMGDESALTKAFFDFRCADIAMGSGHFLVAAVDRIEARLSAWLSLNPIPRVNAELDRLRGIALNALGDLAHGVEIETSSILRRQVARHCIYGVDLNRIAVELARLSIWVHTFVPGLPLSFLDHNLLHGDSLIGVVSVDDAMKAFNLGIGQDQSSLFRQRVESVLTEALKDLERLAATSDAEKREIDDARAAHADAMDKVAPVHELFNVVTAARAGVVNMPDDYNEELIADLDASPEVQSEIARLRPIHFPTAFPEVFLRDRPGFDCVLGNPPWEKVKVETQQWWGMHLPGVRGIPVGRRNREIASFRQQRDDLSRAFEQAIKDADRMKQLLRAVHSHLGAGDTDLYQAFCWRNWQLVRSDGTVGIVTPRQALQNKGCATWRKTVLANGEFLDVTTLLNTGQWVFDDVHGQYQVALLALRKAQHNASEVTFTGPFSTKSHMITNLARRPHTVPAVEFMSWSENATFPQIPSRPGALRLFRKLRCHPRFDAALEECDCRQWRASPIRELDATADKKFFELDDGTSALQGTNWPVYKGESFDLWNPETGIVYDSANEDLITSQLYQKRLRQNRTNTSGFSDIGTDQIMRLDTLPCLKPRIAFRNVTRSSDTRTLISALIPGNVVIAHHAPYLLRQQGTSRDEAFLLGVLSSMILDWYVRRVVELNFSFYIFGNLPIPDVPTDQTNTVTSRLVDISGRLAAPDDRFADWAREVGVPVGSVKSESEKQDLIHELDACVAHLYGLDEADLEILYGTFHANTDYSERHAAVLEHFRRLA
ncbi:MAG: hypothetical protein F4Y80_01140 [Caldilineaceae bacterium SB0665_bin_21]|nr:hypothetical protein [Caldilineaceae bacterium SB0665_bin_21]